MLAISGGTRRKTKRKLFWGFITALALSLIYVYGCDTSDRSPELDRPVAESRLGPDTPLNDDGREWVERTLRGLTVREMAGQVIMAWIPGSYVSTDSEEFDRAVELVESGVGGLWMMGGLPYSRAAKINALQQRAKVPLLVTGGGARTAGTRLFAGPWNGAPSTNCLRRDW